MAYCNEFDHVGIRGGKKVARVDLCDNTFPATLPKTSEGIEGCPTAEEFLPMSTFMEISTGNVQIMGTDGEWASM